MTTKEIDFINLCCRGNFEECKLFYTRNPAINISAENDCAFRLSYLRRHLKVAKFLRHYIPYYVLYRGHYRKIGLIWIIGLWDLV